MNRAETGPQGEKLPRPAGIKRGGGGRGGHKPPTPGGGLDVVLQEPDGTIVICEVKTRSRGMLATPGCRRRPGQTAPADRAAQGICSRPAKAKNRCVLTLQR